MNCFHLVVVIGDQKTRIPIRRPDGMRVYNLITKIQQRNIFTPRKIVALRTSKGECYVNDLLESSDLVFCIFEDLLNKNEIENQKPRISQNLQKIKEKEKEKEKLIPVPETIVPNFEKKGTNKETLTQGIQPNQSLDNSKRIVENYFNNDFLHQSQLQNNQGNDNYLDNSRFGNVQQKTNSELSTKLDYQHLLFEEKYYSESQLTINPNEMVNNKNFDDQNYSNNKTTSTTTATTTSSTTSLTYLTSSSYSSYSENESENENTNGNKSTKRYQNLNTNTIEIRKKMPQSKVNPNPNFDPNTENIKVQLEKVNVNQENEDGSGNKNKNKSKSESENVNVKNKNFKKSEIKQINENVNNDDILKEHEKKKGTKGKVEGDKGNKRKQALMNLKNKKQNKNKNIKDLVMRSLSIDSDADSNQIKEEFTKKKLQFEEELRNLKILVDGEEYEDFSDYSNLSLSDSSNTSNSEEIEEIKNIEIGKNDLRIIPEGNLETNANNFATRQVKFTTHIPDTINKSSDYTIQKEEDQKNLLTSKKNENQNQNQNKT
ncbi:hypothetical protein M0812_08129 [Anaeramoeba flamelloides]|uniref:Doublecortin domain-containing protein n=1 Tax=Anaeramoeba flamelloides TaxID=1746091 RepID=A0AAV8A077_9EUKA|nr:hypothetical protein M0812_08129 [Anaeramoeba flamelloides]